MLFYLSYFLKLLFILERFCSLADDCAIRHGKIYFTQFMTTWFTGLVNFLTGKILLQTAKLKKAKNSYSSVNDKNSYSSVNDSWIRKTWGLS